MIKTKLFHSVTLQSEIIHFVQLQNEIFHFVSFRKMSSENIISIDYKDEIISLCNFTK